MKILIDHNTDDVDVQIEPRDCYDLFTTLAHVIHPALVLFKERQCGSGHVDNEDVPAHLWRPDMENSWDVDEFWQDRWDWVLNEIIWTFDVIKTYYFHYDSDKEKLARIDNGLRLFGKYYTNLWI